MPFASTSKTYVAIAIVIFVCMTVLVPIQKAHAILGIGDVVFDPGNFVINVLTQAAEYVVKTLTDAIALKEYVLDTFAYIAVHTILRAMTNQILGWIKGTDADFVQNLEDEFTRSADAEAGALLNQLTGLNLCGNIGAFLKLSIGAPSQKTFRQRMTCTATQAVSNIEGFYRNFTQGGWNAFLKIALEPQNNAYGAFMLTMNEQAQRVDNKQISLQQRLVEGSGFLGFSVPREKNCQKVSGEDAAILQENLRVQKQVFGKADKPEQSVKADDSDPENPTFSFCDVTYDTKTPGSLFSAALPEGVFSDLRRAQMADEINESVAEIVMALLNKVIEASTKGGSGVLESREISQMPPVTPTDYGFTPTYLTDRADDMSLRLQTVQRSLDAKIQALDAQIAQINAQIITTQLSIDNLQTLCNDGDPLTLCDFSTIDSLTNHIINLQNQKPPLIAERAEQIAFLQRADAHVHQILDLRMQIIATTDPRLIEILNPRLTAVITDAQALIVEVSGPPEGIAGPDPNDNIVRMSQVAQQHADSAIAWLGTRIQAETDAGIKSQMESARDALKKLRDDLDALRTEFLAAVDNKTGITQALGRLTDQINAVNTAVTQNYDRFKSL